jgi:hypothetical protein
MKRIFRLLKPYFASGVFRNKARWTGFSDIHGNQILDGDQIDLIDGKNHKHWGKVRISSRDKEIYFLDKSPYAPYHYEQIKDIIRKNNGQVKLVLR